MLWVLVLHISAVSLWCAALLYFPVLVSGMDTGRAPLSQIKGRLNSIERLVFTHLATPAALVAIISGTVIMLLNRTTADWLIVKLALVAGLVICHALAGLLVLRVERVRGSTIEPSKADAAGAGAASLRRRSRWLLGALGLVIPGILWLVLAKPSLPLVQGG